MNQIKIAFIPLQLLGDGVIKLSHQPKLSY